jgi:SAM-dependent methyltransferase
MSDKTPPVANVEMAAAWDGEEGANWAAHADRYDAGAAAYNAHLLRAARISAPDDIVDIGCGNGSSTRDAARVAAQGTVLGLDLSSRMLAYARERADNEGLTNVSFEQGDAQVHPFKAEAFDVAISRFGAMFFGDPVAAFANIGRALRPNGRLAVLGWQSLADNEWLTATREALALGRELPSPPMGSCGPFGLADPDRNRSILTDAGFKQIEIEDVREPLYWGSDADDAFAFVSDVGPTRGMLHDLDDTGKSKALDNLRELLKRHETPEGVFLGSRAWLITAVR